MKKTIILILLLIPMLCFAGTLQEKQRQVIAKKNVVVGCVDGSYDLMQQEFEGSTNCLASSEPHCDNSAVPFTKANGVINWNYTASSLRGSSSILLNPTDDWAGVYSSSWSAVSEIWVHFLVRMTALPASSTVSLLYLKDGSSNSVVVADVDSAGVITITETTTANHAHSSSSAFAINTTYHIWIHYKAGSGGTGVLDLYFGTTGTRSSATKITTSFTGTATVTFLRPQGFPQTTTNIIYDQIYASTTEITDVCD